ncbi:Thioesterase superfamily protein [Striga hermonthica]|uniref:Thioesterase superfamily protein n=1 Tax=Striga hermonthica TaxID=68872 RepID=A0A9N7NH19_STRHE|nr:Thioesterase superfamily protein [Striga hermonthica]
MVTTKGTPIGAAVSVSANISSEEHEATTVFLEKMGVNYEIKPEHDAKDSFSSLVGGVLQVISVGRGKISCSLVVKPSIKNAYGGMHGGSVAAVAHRVATACAKTVVGKDKDIFLSELSISYLSAAPENVQAVVDGTVIKSGRNLTVVAVNFRLKDSGQLLFATHATFYNMPISSL